MPKTLVGLLNIHKPTGMTSRRVVDLVARRAGTKRVGHAGTLDPLASGVLIVCVEWATRLVTFIQDRPKLYAATFLLGRTSNTDDTTGNVVEVAGAPRPTRADVESALSTFVGEILQVPPQFSAVHVAGKRAHDLARRGMAFDLAPRPVEVYRIDTVRYEFPELDLKIECGSGTYIRSIARDLGSALGCGAVMSALVRERIGDFSLDTAVTVNDLSSRPVSDILLPPLAAVAHLPKHVASSHESNALRLGRPIRLQSDTSFPAGGLVALVGGADDLLALAEFDAAKLLLRPRQVFVGQ